MKNNYTVQSFFFFFDKRTFAAEIAPGRKKVGLRSHQLRPRDKAFLFSSALFLHGAENMRQQFLSNYIFIV